MLSHESLTPSKRNSFTNLFSSFRESVQSVSTRPIQVQNQRESDEQNVMSHRVQ